MNYCVIEYVDGDWPCTNIFIENSNVIINNTRVNNSENYGIYIESGVNPTINASVTYDGNTQDLYDADI